MPVTPPPFDPETHPGRLLWLRADRGVAGSAAAHWDGSTHTRLRSASGSAGLNVGGDDMLFACRVRVNALPASGGYNLGGTHLAGKWGSTLNTSSLREWLLCLNASGGGADQFCFLGRGADDNPARTAIPGGIEEGRWYDLAAWIDATPGSKTINLAVDGVLAVSVPYTGTPADSTTAMTLGASVNHSGTPAISMAGAAFFRAPAGSLAPHFAALVAALYNDGEGTDLSNVTAGQLHAWGLVAHWPLDELGGTRRNRCGGLNHRQNDLEDDSGIGSALGPGLLPAQHNSLIARWIDQVGNRAFAASGDVRWRRSSPRIMAADASANLEHDGLVLAGRSQWTATVVGSLALDRSGVLYEESGGDDAVAIRLDPDGVPELVVTAAGVEHVARASDSLHGMRAVSAASSSDVSFDATARVECTLTIGAGHPLAVADLVAVRGMGAPYDGEHVLTKAGPDSVSYIAEGVPTAQPGDLSAAEVVGRGLVQAPPTMAFDHGTGREAHRVVLSVRRDGQSVAFFRDGTPIGTATLGTAATGPAAGVSRVLGGDAPDGTVEHVYLNENAEPDDAILAQAHRLAVRASRTSGPGPLAVQFDATRFPGVDRMAAQAYHYLWLFARKGERVPHDPWAGGWNGQAYARSNGPFVSQVFEEGGEYEAHLAVVTPHHGRDGQRVGQQQCLFAGVVASITVEPWPEDATIYVSSTHPDRDNAGPGTSPEAPLEGFAQALRRIRRPGTRILLRRGDEFPVGAGQVLSFFRGPMLVGNYGDPAEARPVLNYAVGNTNQLLPTISLEDFRVSGLAIRQVNERRNTVFNTDPNMLGASGGTAGTRDLLYHDLDCDPVAQLLTTSGSRRDRALTIDKCRVDVGGNYGLYVEGVADFGLTRSTLDGEPINHFCRVNRFCRVQVAFLGRTQPHFMATTWVTLRGESCRFGSISDSYGDLIANGGDGPTEGVAGHNWTLVERNRVREIALGTTSRSTARGNNLFLQHSNRTLGWAQGDNIWFGTPEEARAYGNQFVNGVQLLGPRLVSENNRAYNVSSPLVPPAIEALPAAPGLVVLSAYDHGQGGPGEPWLLRWMRKGPGESEFSELAGQRGLAILDLPEAPGEYEYRLDLVALSGAEAAEGEDVLSLEVPDGGGPTATPGVLSPVEVGGTSVTLAWTAATTDPPGLVVATHLQIRQPGGAWSDVPGAATSPAEATGLQPTTDYQFRVRYLAEGAAMPVYSNVVSITTEPEPGGGDPEITPGVLTVVEVGPISVVLSWTDAVTDPPGAAVSAQVEVRQPGGSWSDAADATTSPASVSPLQPETEYEFRVRYELAD